MWGLILSLVSASAACQPLSDEAILDRLLKGKNARSKVMEHIDEECISHGRRRSLRLLVRVGDTRRWSWEGEEGLALELLSNDPVRELAAWERAGLDPQYLLPRISEAVSIYLHYRASIAACTYLDVNGRTKSTSRLLLGRQSASRTDWMRAWRQVRKGQVPSDDNIEGVWTSDEPRQLAPMLDKIETYNLQLETVLRIAEKDWEPHIDPTPVSFTTVVMPYNDLPQPRTWSCSAGI